MAYLVAVALTGNFIRLPDYIAYAMGIPGFLIFLLLMNKYFAMTGRRVFPRCH